MTAFFELLLFATAALGALLLGGRAGKKRNTRGAARTGTMRCPSCGSPAELRDGHWECPYCGDSGIAGRR